jgi:hypothetical protein
MSGNASLPADLDETSESADRFEELDDNDVRLHRYHHPRLSVPELFREKGIVPTSTPAFGNEYSFLFRELVTNVDANLLQHPDVAKEFYVCVEMNYNSLPEEKKYIFGTGAQITTMHQWYYQIVTSFWVDWDHGVALFPQYFNVPGKRNKATLVQLKHDKYYEESNLDRVTQQYNSYVFPESKPGKWGIIPLALPLEKYMIGPCEYDHH